MAVEFSRRRPGHTYGFSVGKVQATLTVAEAPDGRPSEVFLRADKQGSMMAGLCDALAVSTSLALHRAPVVDLVQRFIGPAGAAEETGDPDVPVASSLPDYMARRLAVDYLQPEALDIAGLAAAIPAVPLRS